LTYNGNLLLTSENGSEVYEFSRSTGRHLRTVRPLTGALEYKFSYDTAGYLATITDASGNVTTILRDTSEHPISIVSPYGQNTILGVDNNGFLNSVTDPLGKSFTLVNTSTGLLTSFKDPNGNISTYTYDTTTGRLTKDADPVGGYVMLANTNATSGFGSTSAQTTSMGRTSSFQNSLTVPWAQTSTSTFSNQRTNIWPNGLQSNSSTTQTGSQVLESITLPDGTTGTTTLGPDPVWGLQAPVTTNETIGEGNLTLNITGTRSATLLTVDNPFSLSTETDTQTQNGRSYTSVFTASTRTWANTSPVGRTQTIGLDSLERLASTQIGKLTATHFSYDSNGRLSTATQGARKVTFEYNTAGFLSTVTDPLNLTAGFSYDADGHPLQLTLPDGRFMMYTYDANGNLTSVTPPRKAAHAYTYNAVNLLHTYTPPPVTGTGPTTYDYNLDRNLTAVTRPDAEQILYGYDSAGRLNSIGTPTGTTLFTYDPSTGNVATASTGIELITYNYNGPLPTESAWTGTVAGNVSRSYSDNFWVNSQLVGGGMSVPFQYDNDGLLTGAGSLTVTRRPQDGLISKTTLGVATDSRTYDSFGELIGYTAWVKGIAQYAVTFTFDGDGRVTGKTETVSGLTNTYTYQYDLSGRLVAATKNNAIDTYTYDSNSNRLSLATTSQNLVGTYDAQDRLLTYGTASYTYTANGELATKTIGAQHTLYSYDVLGNLLSVTLPSGRTIAYVIDADNHRVGRKTNGVLNIGFLYDGDQVVAQLDGNNKVVSQFVYGTRSTSPDFMVKGGVTYRIFSDHLGSPVLVVNTSTGAVVEQVTYDEFGNVVADTKPGFQPFGFAGGLYDQDTKLVRFGARDYDPAAGRWTAKDPSLYDSSDTNFYVYAGNDPINFTDPGGTDDTATFVDPAPGWYLKAVHAEQHFRKWIKSKACAKCQGKDSAPTETANETESDSEPSHTIEKIQEYVRNVHIIATIEAITEAAEGVVGHVVGPIVEILEGSEQLPEGAEPILRHKMQLSRILEHDEVQEQCPNQ
jgi:RHS repeat-associated protein